MTNTDKLQAIFMSVFGVDASVLTQDFKRENVTNWDSVRQLSLTNGIEDAFDIMLDPEDIIGCTSYDNAKAVLAKYDIDLNA